MFLQVYWVDTSLVVVLLVVVVLVQAPGHQYGPSTLSPFWFLLSSSLLVALGCLSLALAWLQEYWEEGEEEPR